LLAEYHLEDISMVAFPLLAASVEDAFGLDWRFSSTGDLIDILMQALEVMLSCLAFEQVLMKD
jgi:hypothetical protein